MDINFPINQKGMCQFLGTGVFFQPFIQDFAAKASNLYEMTKDSFDWNPESWKLDYRDAFERLKEEMGNSVKLYFPDYSLPWFLQTDASQYALKKSQMIVILSGKFSNASELRKPHDNSMEDFPTIFRLLSRAHKR